MSEPQGWPNAHHLPPFSGDAFKLGTITGRKTHVMHNVSIQKASALPPRLKSAVEQLLGRPIDADEEVSDVSDDELDAGIDDAVDHLLHSRG